jgi:hypothetical protein
VLDVLVPELVPYRPGIVTVIGKLEAAAVPQHVRVNREWHLRPCADPAE